ncbi:MAG: PAS domain-containing protein [Oligoflexus sp.]
MKQIKQDLMNQKQALAVKIFTSYCFLMVFIICYVGIQILFWQSSAFRLIPSSSALLIAIFCLHLSKKKQIDIAMFVFHFGILLSIILTSYFQPEFTVYSYIFTVIPLMITSFLQSLKATVTIALVQIGSLILACFFHPDLPENIASVIFYIIILSILVTLSQKQRQSELKSLDKALELLEKSEETLRLSITAIGDGSWDWDLRTGKIYISEHWCKFLGCSKVDLIGQREIWRERVHPDDIDELQRKIQAHLLGETKQFSCKYRLLHNLGHYSWLLAKGKVVQWDESGNPLRLVGSVTDITEDMAQQINLMESERNLKEAQAIGNIGSWYFDLIKHEIQVTDQIQRIYGGDISQDTHAGTHYMNNVHPDDQDIVDYHVGECIKTGKPYNYVYRIIRPDDKLVYIRINGRGIQDKQGNVIALQGTCQDVSSTILQQQELQLAMEKANQAVEAKARFLANMSHEIRTPLNGLLGYAELLSESPLNAQQSQYLEIMKNAGQHLLGVVNDILDYSKVESGKIQIEENDFSLAEKLKSIIAIYHPQANAKGLNLFAEISSGLPEVVRSDEFRFAQIVTNLLSNAIKFTEKGQVFIHVSLKEKLPKHYIFQFEVSDTGIGISSADQSKLFQSFSQVDSSISRKYGGTGLGLVIAKKLSRLLGGELWFSSEAGIGSRFYFSIRTPITQTASDPLTPSLTNRPRKRKTRLNNFRILIVEDNPINQELAKSFLRKLGYQADVANNGIESIRAQEHAPYQLMFMDMQMPEMDGVQATKILRQRWSSEQLKIVAMTANAMESDRDICLAAGMDGFISKPFSKLDIAQVIYEVNKEYLQASN